MSFRMMGMEIPTDVTAYKRVLQKASMPETSDWLKTAGIATAGIAFVGGMGFFIYVIMSFLPT